MKSTFLKINWILLIVLSISTGLFKLMQQQADIQLFAAIGMNASLTTMLGGIQLIGGLMLVPGRTRKSGAIIMIPTFILASIAVFANGMMIFGVVSLLFIWMAYLVIVMENQTDKKSNESK